VGVLLLPASLLGVALPASVLGGVGTLGTLLPASRRRRQSSLSSAPFCVASSPI
jgi:hypothetical protein